MSPGAPLPHWLRNSTRAQLSWAVLQGCAPWPCTLLTLLSWLGSLAGPPASLVGGSDVVSTGPLAPSPHCSCPVHLLLVLLCSALVEHLVPEKGCVKNKTSFKTEGCVSCISITNLLGGCTRLPLPQLLSHFLSGMPLLKCCEQQLSCPPLPTLCCKANKQPACQGWEAGQPGGFLQNLCVSGGGRWWNPWRAELFFSRSPYNCMPISLHSLCGIPGVLKNRNWDEFSNYICFREGIFPLTYLFSSAALQPLGIKSITNFDSVFRTHQKSLKTLTENRLQSFQWIKSLLGGFHFFNLWGLPLQESQPNLEHLQNALDFDQLQYIRHLLFHYSFSHSTTEKPNVIWIAESLHF